MKTISIKDKVTVEASADIQTALSVAWQTLTSEKASEVEKKTASESLAKLAQAGDNEVDAPATEDWLETVKVSNDVQGVCKVILRDIIRTLAPVGYRWLADAREDYCQQASRAKSQIIRAKSRDASTQWTGESQWGNLRRPLLQRLHMAAAHVYKLRALGVVDKDYRQSVNWEQLEKYHAEANKLGT